LNVTHLHRLQLTNCLSILAYDPIASTVFGLAARNGISPWNAD